MSVSFTKLAELDLNELWEHLALAAGIDVAEHVLADIEAAIDRISTFPEIGQLRGDLSSPVARWWLVHRYYIVYVVDGRSVLVVRILHSSRDVGSVMFTTPTE